MYYVDMLHDDFPNRLPEPPDVSSLFSLDPEQRHVPALLQPEMLTVSSVIRIQKMLRRFANHAERKQLPDYIVDVVRDTVIDATEKFDSVFAVSVVEDFWKVSKPLNLNFEDPAFTADMAERLMKRLQQDLTRFDKFAAYRISSVQEAFNHMGTPFTKGHRDDVAEWIYDRFDTQFRITQEDLDILLRHTEDVLERMDLGMKAQPQIALTLKA